MRTLIIATDLGHTSRSAVTYGVSLARDLGAEALLVHAWQPTQITVMDATLMLPPERVAEHANDLRRQLDAIADQQRARWPRVSARLLDGDLEHVITDLVAETNAEMVVVGTSLPNLITRLLGSEAQKVIRAVHCPVLVVHEPD
jgi:nucleotide-binding universal stress UspA family protein